MTTHILKSRLTPRRRLAAISTVWMLLASPTLAQGPSGHVYDPKTEGGQTVTALLASIHARESELRARSKQLGEESQHFPIYRGDGQNVASKMATALRQAAASGRGVLLVFHASWCTPCQLLMHLLKDSKASPIIQSRYVIVDIDVFEHTSVSGENPGGKALYQKYGGDGPIPFYVVLGSSGQFVRNSMVDGQDLGYPEDLTTISSFMKILQTSKQPFSDSDSVLMKQTLIGVIHR